MKYYIPINEFGYPMFEDDDVLKVFPSKRSAEEALKEFDLKATTFKEVEIKL